MSVVLTRYHVNLAQEFLTAVSNYADMVELLNTSIVVLLIYEVIFSFRETANITSNSNGLRCVNCVPLSTRNTWPGCHPSF